MFSHLTQSPDTLKKLREEFKTIKSETLHGDLDLLDYLGKTVTLETVNRLEYTNWLVLETLRIQSPASATTFLNFKEDTKVGGINFRQGDEFCTRLRVGY